MSLPPIIRKQVQYLLENSQCLAEASEQKNSFELRVPYCWQYLRWQVEHLDLMCRSGCTGFVQMPPLARLQCLSDPTTSCRHKAVEYVITCDPTCLKSSSGAVSLMFTKITRCAGTLPALWERVGTRLCFVGYSRFFALSVGQLARRSSVSFQTRCLG